MSGSTNRPLSAKHHSRRRIPSGHATSFSANYAMTGNVGPAVRDADRPVPFFAVDDPVPFDLARGEGMSVWGDHE